MSTPEGLEMQIWDASEGFVIFWNQNPRKVPIPMPN